MISTEPDSEFEVALTLVQHISGKLQSLQFMLEILSNPHRSDIVRCQQFCFIVDC